jgi:hypothetical protein
MYLGRWEIDDLLTFTVTTHTFATGALTDADAPPDYRIYEDETGTAILTGTMAKLDDASTTGHYSEQVTLSAANGFEVGKSYSVYITAAVSSVTGGAVRNFQVEAAGATAAAIAALNNLSAAQVNAEVDTALSDYDGPTNAELATALGTADDATLSAIAALNNLSSAQAQTAAAAALTAYDPPTHAELTSGLAAADDAVLAAIAALNNLSSAGAQAAAAAALLAYSTSTLTEAQVNAQVVDVLRTDTIPDSYAADGAQPTIAQAMLMLLQFLSERSVSGTTVTVRKPDGATSAMTFTLSDATNPASITRAS